MQTLITPFKKGVADARSRKYLIASAIIIRSHPPFHKKWPKAAIFLRNWRSLRDLINIYLYQA